MQVIEGPDSIPWALSTGGGEEERPLEGPGRENTLGCSTIRLSRKPPSGRRRLPKRYCDSLGALTKLLELRRGLLYRTQQEVFVIEKHHKAAHCRLAAFAADCLRGNERS